MKCRFMCLSLFVTSFFDIYESIRIYTKYKKQRERVLRNETLIY